VRRDHEPIDDEFHDASVLDRHRGART
jgi:hypothetical protein